MRLAFHHPETQGPSLHAGLSSQPRCRRHVFLYGRAGLSVECKGHSTLRCFIRWRGQARKMRRMIGASGVESSDGSELMVEPVVGGMQRAFHPLLRFAGKQTLQLCYCRSGMVIVLGRADKLGQRVRIADHAFRGGSCLSDVRRIGRQPAPTGAGIGDEGCQKLSNLGGDSSRRPRFADERGHVKDR